MRPKYYPNWVNEDNIKMGASKVGRLTSKEAISQLWHSNGKCPKGTIPIIRTKKEDVLRADSIESYGKKLNGVGDDHEVTLFSPCILTCCIRNLVFLTFLI